MQFSLNQGQLPFPSGEQKFFFCRISAGQTDLLKKYRFFYFFKASNIANIKHFIARFYIS